MEKIMFTRRSVRNFKNANIPHTELLKIIEAATSAPSARNQQPWEFIIVDNQTLLNKISEKASPLYAKANKVIILCFNKEKLITPDMVSQDMSAATMNMLLMARKLNIGSCWIGTYPKQERMDNLRQVLNIPTNLEPFGAIALGYPADENAFCEVKREAKIYYNGF